MGMCVTSVNPSKGILPVKFLTPSPHPLFLCPEVLSLECQLKMPAQRGLRKTEFTGLHQDSGEGEGRRENQKEAKFPKGKSSRQSPDWQHQSQVWNPRLPGLVPSVISLYQAIHFQVSSMRAGEPQRTDPSFFAFCLIQTHASLSEFDFSFNLPNIPCLGVLEKRKIFLGTHSLGRVNERYSLKPQTKDESWQ